MQETLRLSKYLAIAGVASRRKCDVIIRSGAVKVNNITVKEPFTQVSPDIDSITINNCIVYLPGKKSYYALNKPRNYLSDLNFSDDRSLARSLIPTDVYLFPVGRLDYDSEGLILFTNDGVLANKIMHPRYGVEKEYLVKLKGHLREEDLKSVQCGLMIDGSIAKVSNISEIRRSVYTSWYRLVLLEGRNRIIRRIADVLGHPVLKLKRVRIAHITLGDLKSGHFRELSEREIRAFQ